MSKELLPCPFCGHAPFHRPKVNDGRWITDCNTVTCIRPTTGLCRTEAEAVTAWNTRATDHHDEAEAYRNRCERAEAEAAELREEIARIYSKIDGFRFDSDADVFRLIDEIANICRAALGGNRDG